MVARQERQTLLAAFDALRAVLEIEIIECAKDRDATDSHIVPTLCPRGFGGVCEHPAAGR
jgi:hypothetical protein